MITNAFRYCGLIVFVLGSLAWIVLGNGANLALHWPGMILYSLAGFCVAFHIFIVRKRFPFASLTVGLLVGFLVSRAAFSPVEYLARRDIFLVISCLMGYSISSAVLETERTRVVFWSVMFLSLVIQVGIGARQYYVDSGFYHLSMMGLQRVLNDAKQASGFFNHGNHFSFHLVILLFLALAAAFYHSNRFIRILAGAIVVAAIFGIVISTCRAAVLAVGAGAIVFVAIYWISRNKMVSSAGGRRVWVASFMVAILVVIGAVGLFGSVTKSVHGAGFFGRPGMRPDMWSMAIRQWKTSPWFGTGSRSYEYYSRKYRPATHAWAGSSDQEAVFAHNEVLQLGAEYGSAGVGLLLFAAGAHFVRGLLLLKNDDEVPWQVVGALCALCAISVHTLFDFNLHIGANAVFVAVCFGILGQSRRAQKGIPSPIVASVLGFASCFMIYQASTGAVESEIEGWKARRAALDGEFLLAVGLYRVAEEHDPSNYNWSISKGNCYRIMGNSEDLARLSEAWIGSAIGAFENAASLYPQSLRANLSLAQLYSETGDYEQAEGKYQNAMEWAPTFRKLLISYGDHQARFGRYPEALKCYRDAIQMNLYGPEKKSLLILIRDLEKVVNPQE